MSHPTPTHNQNNLYNGENSQMSLYERMLTTSRSAIFTLSETLHIVSVSESVSTLLGYETAQLIGQLYTDLIVERFKVPFSNLVVQRDTAQLDYPLMTKSNDWYWVHHSGEHIQSDTTAHYEFMIQDVHRYKRPHSEAEKERNMLQEIMDNLPVAIHATDENGKIIFSNQTLASLLGTFAVDDILGAEYQDIFETTMGHHYARQDQHVISSGSTLSDETRYSGATDDPNWMSVTKLPMHNSQGTITGVISIARNITHEKESQQKLADSEARQRALLDALPDMMIVVKRDGTVTEFRATPEVKSLGVDESVVGKHIQDTPFPQPLTDEVTLYLGIQLSAQHVHTFEFPQGTGDTAQHYEARVVRLNDDEIMALVRNVTSIKQIQDELSRHIEDLQIVRQVNVELSADLNVNYVAQLALDAALRLSNAQAGYLVMVEPDEKLSLMSMVGQYDLAEIERKLHAPQGIVQVAIAKNEARLIRDVQAIDTSSLPILPSTQSVIVFPLHSNDRIVGVLMLEARDSNRFVNERFQFLQLITGRIAAFLDNAMLHRQTKEQYEAVRSLEQLKTDMIRIASHDLKNPLAGIMGYSEMLRMDAKDKMTEKELNYLDKIDVAAKKMQRITSGILSLERIEQLSVNETREPINLTSLVKRSVSEQMDYAVRSEQTLHRYLPDYDVYILGDALQLHEALSNLVQNAIKYTPAKGTVEVTLTIEDSTAVVRVNDTGYGIPEDQQDRLFTPFYRAKTSETRFIEGTGLGLHLVKNIIERHNGTMIFSSTYGEGSEFGFMIATIPQDHLDTD